MITRNPVRVAAIGRQLWRTEPLLTGFAALTTAGLAAALLGLWLDPRMITGAPAWLKPAKFAASITIYSLTLAWLFAWLPHWPRLRRRVGRISVAVFMLELAIIYAQAWRGTTSHFNVATPLDGALFSVMGVAIVLQTLASASVAVALWRTVFADRALGWALRHGMTLTLVGASTGGLMTRPTPAQLEQARASHRLQIAGAHTVGAPDGGPGLPGTGWSVTHGDLRVAHFVGLHAVQLLPLLGLALTRRRWPQARRVRVILAAAASYALLFVLLLSQALLGQSVINPEGPILVALTAWVVFTVGALATAAARPAADAAAAAAC